MPLPVQTDVTACVFSLLRIRIGDVLENFELWIVNISHPTALEAIHDRCWGTKLSHKWSHIFLQYERVRVCTRVHNHHMLGEIYTGSPSVSRASHLVDEEGYCTLFSVSDLKKSGVHVRTLLT